MKNIRFILYVSMLLIFPFVGKSETDPDWSCDIHAYQYDMSVYLSLQKDGESVLGDYLVAAFCGEECRGIAELQTVKEATFYYIRIRSQKSSGESISFKVYDRSVGKEQKASGTLSFASLEQVGYPSQPWILTLPTVVDPENGLDDIDETTQEIVLTGTWTQEKIDETIAMYEEMLQDIKNGVKYSKTVDGQEDVLIAMNPGPIDTTVEVSMDINSTESDELTQKKMLDLYGDYGISFDESGNMLFQGDLVRLFWDGVDAGDGASSVLCQYYNEKGTVDVHTVRSVIDNGDGSVDPFGKLIKIEKDSQEVLDRRDLDEYLSAGTATTTASGFSNSNDGTSFAEVMKKYAEFGIRYESGDGLGNIYYNNQLVKTFIDKNKQGDVFTLSSEDGGEIVVHTVYDKKGNLTGVEIE